MTLPLRATPNRQRIVFTVSPEEPNGSERSHLRADGRTPLEGARLYVYHTDAQGYDSRPRNDPHRPRIRGWIKTGADGQYEFRTLKPAPYPGRYIRAHIHGTVAAPGYPSGPARRILVRG